MVVDGVVLGGDNSGGMSEILEYGAVFPEKLIPYGGIVGAEAAPGYEKVVAGNCAYGVELHAAEVEDEFEEAFSSWGGTWACQALAGNVDATYVGGGDCKGHIHAWIIAWMFYVGNGRGEYSGVHLQVI
jgi:hypothetical protein